MTSVELNRRDVYLTPLGHRCALTVQATKHERVNWFSFVYIGLPGGFALTRENVPLLRKELIHVTPAR